MISLRITHNFIYRHYLCQIEANCHQPVINDEGNQSNLVPLTSTTDNMSRKPFNLVTDYIGMGDICVYMLNLSLPAGQQNEEYTSEEILAPDAKLNSLQLKGNH